MTQHRVVFTRAAEADIEAIGDRIALRAPMEAVKFIRALRERAQHLATFPHSGTPRPRWGAGVRIEVHGNDLIIYRVRGEIVEVLRVLHGARNIDALLADDPLPG